MVQAYTIDFVDGPAAFLDAAGDYLESDPVVNTVIATTAQRQVAELAQGLSVEGIEKQWWAVVRDASGSVRSAAMQTATSHPYPPYLLPMPEEAARSLAALMVDRGEQADGVNGALPAIAAFADAMAAASGSVVKTAMHTRLFELGELVTPAGVPGALRAATPGDLKLAVRWFRDFQRDAGEQGGHGSQERPDDDEAESERLRRRIDGGRLWFWEVDGEPVHMSGGNPPSFGVARLGPVFTPVEHRRHGYAAAAVAAVSRLYVDRGARVCLFTDQANPTSNKVYRSIGFEPVVDMANLVLVRATS